MRSETTGSHCSKCKARWAANDFERLDTYSRPAIWDGEPGSMIVALCLCRRCGARTEVGMIFNPHPARVQEGDGPNTFHWRYIQNPVLRN